MTAAIGRPIHIRYRIHQRFAYSLPSSIDAETVQDAIDGIEDPDPCLVSDAPAGLSLKLTIETVEASVDGGELSADRCLLFTLQIGDPKAFHQWCASSGLSADSELIPSHLFEDFEGSWVGDEMVDYDNDIDVILSSDD